MYRIIVADDEWYVVNWMVELLNTRFSDLDVRKAGTGLDVLQAAESATFDFAILDIVMPGLNGIETAKRLLAKFPNCKILLLTGYEEFDLIYQVNNIKNIRYSLKTEGDEQIVEKIQEMFSESENEKRNRQIIDAASRKDLLIRHFEQRGILYDIFFESLGEEDIRKKASSYGPLLTLNPKNPVNAVLIYFPHNDATQHTITNDLLLQMYRSFEETIQRFFHFALLDTNRDCVLLLIQPKEDLSLPNWKIALRGELDRGLTSLEQLQNRSIRFYIAEKFSPWHKISHIYSFILYYSRNREPESTNAPLFGTMIQIPDTDNEALSEKSSIQNQFSHHLQKLSASLIQGNSESFREGINSIQTIVPGLYKSSESNQAELRGKFAMIFINYINLHHLQNELEQKFSLMPLYRAISTQNWDALISYGLRLSNEIFALSTERKERDSVRTIHSICDYINAHLSEPLSVNLLAEEFNYNPSYISRLFKQTQGESLSQYLKDARLNKAKTLLCTTTLSIQEISDMVGFDTVQYFSMVFRKEIGMTPKSFRNA